MDAATVRSVVEIKVVVAATLVRIAGVLDIQRGWETDDEGIEAHSLRVRLACEYSSSELEAAQQLCQQIISLPPPYAASQPDERLHQFYELHARLDRVSSFIEGLREAIQMLEDECDNLTQMKITEAQERAKDALNEVDEAVKIIPGLVRTVQERVLVQAAFSV